MTETIFMCSALVLLVYIAYVQRRTYVYTQYVLVTAAGLLKEVQEMKQWFEEEDEYGETQRFH